MERIIDMKATQNKIEAKEKEKKKRIFVWLSQ